MIAIENVPLASVPLPMLLLDNQGYLLAANVLAQDCLGQSERRLLGQHLGQLFAPESEIVRLIDRVAASGGGISDHSITLRAGAGPCSLHLGQSEQGVSVIFIPESNRSELEQHVKRQEMAEAMARIALEMAHEVKNPLAALRGAAQWLSEQPLNENAAEATRMMLGEVERIRLRIDSFLQLAPRADAMLEPINVHTLIDDVCKGVGAGLVRRVYDPSLPEILVHPSRLRQAFENLWSNALEAQPGFIEIQTRVAPTVRLPDCEGAVLEIRFTNDGSAIPPEMVERLFEPFVTGKARGSGLGLAIVQRVMLEHRGRASVRAEKGRTSLILHLPIRER